MRTSMLLTNLLVTVLQSTLIKRGDQSQLAVRVKRGGARRGPAGPVMWIKAAEKWTLSLFHCVCVPAPLCLQA